MLLVLRALLAGVAAFAAALATSVKLDRSSVIGALAAALVAAAHYATPIDRSAGFGSGGNGDRG